MKEKGIVRQTIEWTERRTDRQSEGQILCDMKRMKTIWEAINRIYDYIIRKHKKCIKFYKKEEKIKNKK